MLRSLYMAHYVYIIKSEAADKFYIGESEDPETRVKQHNSGHFKGGSTSMSRDWKLYLSISCGNRIVARRIEKHIKSMKSTKYIRNLFQYNEMVEKLIAKYDS